jgi:transcriptional regulator GlxA family with amidase domain
MPNNAHTRMQVGILVFHEVEVLDFAGPYEVFSIARNSFGDPAFDVKLIAQKKGILTASKGLKIFPDLLIDETEAPEVLVVPGGYGARVNEIHNTPLIEWLKVMHSRVSYIASVCTGAYLLAEAGLLDGISVTTHWKHTKPLAETYPSLRVEEGVKFTDGGKVLTSAGVSAGINLSLYIVGKILGRKAAEDTAREMEFEGDWTKSGRPVL